MGYSSDLILHFLTDRVLERDRFKERDKINAAAEIF